jgi:DHA1 family bicyclomycin/chloramphenicol resistance-like MFS transporter
MVKALARPPTEFGLYFLLMSGGYLLGNALVARFVGRKGIVWLINAGVLLAAVGTAIALALILLGWRHPLAIFLPIVLLATGHGMALTNVMASAVGLAPKHAGIASSLMSFIQQLAGAVGMQLTGLFSMDSALPMLIFCAGVSLLGLLALLVFPPTRLA